jgi:hypothetical protein
MSKKLTTEDFIQKAQLVHRDLYNYSKVNYINSCSKINIVCYKHGDFWQTPNAHLSKYYGCPDCGGTRKLTTEIFIKKSKELYGDIYDYSKSNYIDAHTKTNIYCNKHKEYFWQEPGNHLFGQGCPICGMENKKSNLEEFIKKAKIIHNNKYNYDKFVYINSHIKGLIGCPIKDHNYFNQNPFSHLQGYGCHRCKISQGNRTVEKYLKSNNIKYIIEYIFKNCKYKRYLPFDFYLQDLNILIEYDGQQHFSPVRFNSISEEKEILKFEKVKICDAIKTKYCIDNNIKLIRIPYWDFDRIEDILTKELNFSSSTPNP